MSHVSPHGPSHHLGNGRIWGGENGESCWSDRSGAVAAQAEGRSGVAGLAGSPCPGLGVLGLGPGLYTTAAHQLICILAPGRPGSLWDISKLTHCCLFWAEKGEMKVLKAQRSDACH